jgi:lysophospholipase L1-like esterase
LARFDFHNIEFNSWRTLLLDELKNEAFMNKILITITTIVICACFVQSQKSTAEPDYYPIGLSGDTWTGEITVTNNATKNARWIATWAAAPDSPGPPLKAQTVRQIIRTSIGGSSLRIRLSNLFGTASVTFGPVHVAKAASGSAIKQGTDHAVTFGGKPTVTIARGTDALSDPVTFRVAALEELAVSLYLPAGTETSTIHSTAIQTAFISPGDATAATIFPKSETDNSRYFLTDIEVAASADARAIVIVGDSVTDGVGSTEDGNARWPDALAARLQANQALASIAIVNSGISGNRILNDGAEPYLGPSTLARFDRDALNKLGVRWILLLQGINDITAAEVLKTPRDQVSAQQIIDGMKTLIARAHKKGIKIWGATLLPRGGAQGSRPHTAAGEAKRQTLNAWIRTSGAFDAVIDFEQVMRDPARPDHLNPAFDSGDHTHPNDAGYKAMAAAIDLRLFTGNK